MPGWVEVVGCAEEEWVFADAGGPFRYGLHGGVLARRPGGGF